MPNKFSILFLNKKCMDIGHVIIYVIYITSIKYFLDAPYRKKKFQWKQSHKYDVEGKKEATEHT